MPTGVRDGLVVCCVALIALVVGLVAPGELGDTAVNVAAVIGVIGLALVGMALAKQRG